MLMGEDAGFDDEVDAFWLFDWGLIESLASLRCRICKIELIYEYLCIYYFFKYGLANPPENWIHLLI